MTQLVTLQPVANQQLSATFGDDRYQMTLKETNGVMAVTLIRNDETLYTNLRTVAGTPLIPYRYQQRGNLIFETQDEEIPYYNQFGITQFLIYASASEISGEAS
jgi:hypothetical protein